MQIGYARVSTQDQDLRLQYEALRQVPCDKIYEDKASGAQASREGLKLALDVCGKTIPWSCGNSTGWGAV